MLVSIVSSLRAKHQLEHQKVLAEGLKVLGIQPLLCFFVERVTTPIVACWGWRNGIILRERGHDVIIMERGYIADRFAYTSLAWNGLNGHADFPDYPDDGGERFRSMGVEIKPWKTGGDYALILGQVPGDASLQGLDLMPWYEDVAEQIDIKHGLPVHFRPHPDVMSKGIMQNVQGTVPSQGTLQEALSGAAFTVCFNSNSSVDSVLAGVPCIVGDRGSMAYDMCGKSVKEIIRPDRTDWAHQLAWKQWSLDEIKSGEALKCLF